MAAVESSPPALFRQARLWKRVVAVTAAAVSTSGAMCFTAYWLIGMPLVQPGATGKVALLAPLLTPLFGAPIVVVPFEIIGRRNTRLLIDVESARADLAAEIAEHMHARAQLELLVRHDPLTGLLNRRGFFEFAHARAHVGLTLLTVDVDNFKAVNDLRGHAAGDKALCAVAATMRVLGGPDACIARIGGDEFAMLVNAAPDSIARDARDLLTRVPVTLTDRPTIEVSASVGLAQLDRATTIDEALAIADDAMYAVKRERHTLSRG
jgi:diguanylate cyclase (GGDEF)-like protein